MPVLVIAVRTGARAVVTELEIAVPIAAVEGTVPATALAISMADGGSGGAVGGAKRYVVQSAGSKR